MFMQHWYWNKYPTLFNFELKLKVVKAIKHFFLKKICALHIQRTNYFKITLFTYKLPPLHNEQLK